MEVERGRDPEREARFALLMSRIAMAVLVVGISTAAVIFLLVPADEDAAAAWQDTRQYELAMERIGGKAVLIAAEINDWLGSLWHGRKLAATVAALSVGASWLCYLASKPPR